MGKSKWRGECQVYQDFNPFLNCCVRRMEQGGVFRMKG